MIMKKLRMILFLCLFAATKAFAQTPEDDKIFGTWMSEDKTGKIDVYKANGKYFGKLIWGKTMYEPDGTTSRKDVKNKDEKLRSRNLKDLVMLYDFTYHDEAWDGGQIYDPYSGNTYSCTLKLKDGKLNIRGYIGVSLFGRTSVWERGK
jgi:uncharacterized protein (DUF2147 family)